MMKFNKIVYYVLEAGSLGQSQSRFSLNLTRKHGRHCPLATCLLRVVYAPSVTNDLVRYHLIKAVCSHGDVVWELSSAQQPRAICRPHKRNTTCLKAALPLPFIRWKLSAQVSHVIWFGYSVIRDLHMRNDNQRITTKRSYFSLHAESMFFTCASATLSEADSALTSVRLSVSSNRQHLSYDGCLAVRKEIIRIVLCCIGYWSCAQL